MEAATVAAHGVAEASEAASKATPKLADAAVKNGDNIAGIMADVHTATTAGVKPRSPWGKIKSVLWLIEYGAAHAFQGAGQDVEVPIHGSSLTYPATRKKEWSRRPR